MPRGHGSSRQNFYVQKPGLLDIYCRLGLLEKTRDGIGWYEAVLTYRMMN